MKRRRWPWILAILCAVGLAGLVFAWRLANSNAHRQLTSRIRQATGLNVNLGDVSVGFGGIDSRNVTIGDIERPVLRAETMTIEMPTSELIDDEPTIDTIRLENVTVALAANEKGSLQWPFSPDGSVKFPSDRMEIVNANVAIRQPDRDTLSVEGINLSIVKHNQGLQIEGDIDRFLNSEWKVAGTSGRRQSEIIVSASKVAIDSGELAKQAMIPELPTTTVRLTGSIQIGVRLSDTAPLFRSLIEFRNASLTVPQLELSLTDVGADVEATPDELVVDTFSAALGDGRIDGRSTIDLEQAPYRGRFDVSVNSVPAEAVRTLTRIPEVFSGDATGQLRGELEFTTEMADLSIDGKGQIENAKIQNVPVESVSTELSIRGMRIRQDASRSMEGEVRLSDIRLTDAPLEELLKLLPEQFGEAMPDVVGQVSAAGQLILPLQTITQPATWTATATVDAKAIELRDQSLRGDQSLRADQSLLADQTVQAFSGAIQLARGQIDLSNMVMTLAHSGTLSATAHLSLDRAQPSQLSLTARDIPAAMIAVLLKLDSQEESTLAQEVEGAVDCDARLEIPANRAFDVSQLNGKVTLSSQRIAWNDIDLNDISCVCQVSDSTLVVTSVSARTANGGRIRATGVVPFDRQELARIEIHSNNAPIDQFLRLGAQANQEFARTVDRWSSRFADGHLPLSGDASVTVSVAVRPRDINLMSAWSGNATFQSSNARFATVGFKSIDSAMVLDNGEFQVRTFRAQLKDGGEVSAQALLPLATNDTVPRAAIRWTDLPVDVIDRLVPLTSPLAGRISGRFTIAAPQAKLENLAAMTGSGQIVLEKPSVAGTTFENISAEIHLANNRFGLRNIRMAGVQAHPARFAINLEAPHRYVATVATREFQLAQLVAHGVRIDPSNIDRSFDGTAMVEARIAGDLNGGPLSARGQIQVRDLRMGKRRLSGITMSFRSMDSHEHRIRVVGSVFGGRIEGIVDSPTSPGDNLIEVTLDGLELAESEWLTNRLGVHDLKTSGKLAGEVRVQSWDDPAARTVQLRLRNIQTQFAGIDLKDLEAELSMKNGVVEGRLLGQVLDGELSVTGSARLTDRWLPDHVHLDVHLHAVQLRSLGRQSTRYAQWKQLAGAADLRLDLQLVGPDFTSNGKGVVQTRQVSWSRKPISSTAQAQLIIGNGHLRLHEIQAAVGKGSVGGSIDLPLTGMPGGRYDLIARGIDLFTLLQFTNLESSRSRGSVDGRLSGTIDAQIRGRGSVELRRLLIHQVAAESVRIPVNYVLDTRDLSGRVATRQMIARIADGLIASDATINFGRRLGFEAKSRISGIDSGELIQMVGGRRDFDQGKLSGTLQASGNGVRSLRDVRGRFLGQLENSQSLQLPLLNDLAAFANVGYVSRSSFRSDKIDLRLSNGIVSTPGLTLRGNQAELFITGRAYIDQRLDLEVALQAGNVRPNFGLDSLIDSPAASVVAPGASIYLQAAEYLSSRIIYVHVGGTLRSPHFQLRTDRMLRDELLRYYLPDWQYQQIRNYR